MNAAAANIIVQGVLKGAYDVFDALLSLSFQYDATDTVDLSSDDLATTMDTYPVAMRGRVKGGGGMVILYTMNDATRLVSMTNTGDPTAKDSLDESDLEVLQEIADSALGGGVANLSEKFGEDVELEGVEVLVETGDAHESLRELLGDAIVKASYVYSADPHFDSASVLMYSESLEGRVPGSLLGEGDAGESVDEALVSDEEIQDILSGFGGGENGGGAGIDGLPGNLEVIMDIELTATARLGHVEMTIAEILNFGPGSIIEVGHLVDEPVELMVNDKLIARGDVVVVDEKFGLRITEIVSQKERLESLS